MDKTYPSQGWVSSIQGFADWAFQIGPNAPLLKQWRESGFAEGQKWSASSFGEAIIAQRRFATSVPSPNLAEIDDRPLDCFLFRSAAFAFANGFFCAGHPTREALHAVERATDAKPGQAAWPPVMGRLRVLGPGIAFSGSEEKLAGVRVQFAQGDTKLGKWPCDSLDRGLFLRPTGASFIMQGDVQTSEGVAQSNSKAM
jgi:hypothetical protein